MKTEIKGGLIYRDGSLVENKGIFIDNELNGRESITIENSLILPSFCDVHVHFREPGQSYKETIRTGSLAASRGGYTTVCAMPNLDPPPGDLESLRAELDIIERDAVVHVLPYGTITAKRDGRGALADMEALAPYVCAFSDDGTGVQERANMRDAMELAKSVGKLIVAHCEDEELVHQGKIRESEWRQIERDIMLADETGCGYHVCHISCKESVEIIRDAKKSGVNVTCETAPHYLLLNTGILEKEINKAPALGGRFKMNPPIKDVADMEALIEGCVDGTVDMIATDHAPHSDEEKSRGFAKSLNGITGLECAFPAMYTGLIKTGAMSFERLIDMMAISPRKRFDISEPNSFVVVDLNDEYVIDPSTFLSKGKWTPFDGYKVFGQTLFTVCDGKLVYSAI